jgi:hypothetical protein
MSRLLLALALLVALLAAGATVLWLGAPPDTSRPAAPEEVDGQAHGQASELRAAGASAEGRRTSPSAGSAGPDGAAAGDPVAASRFVLVLAVQDPAGTSIAGARASVEEPSATAAVTDAAGLAYLEVPAGTRQLVLRVEAEGFFHASLTTEVASRLEVTLHPAATARGRVVERGTRLGIEGARVALDDGHPGCEPVSARSAADGSFELPEVPVGTGFVVTAAADGYADARLPVQLLSLESAAELELLLEPSAGVRLAVVDFQTGRPVSGARLLDLPDAPAADEQGRLDAGRLVSESAGSLWVQVGAAGYCGLSRRIEASEWAETGVVQVPLLVGARFEGVVRDAQGDPVAGAAVGVIEADFRWRARQASAASGLEGWPRGWALLPEELAPVLSATDGRFVTPCLPPLTEGWQLEVSAAGLAPARVDPGRAAAPGQAREVEVRLEPLRTGTIRGRLTLNGDPIGGTVIWRGSTSQGRGPADPSGRFELTQVEAGALTLRAEPADGEQRYGQLAGAEVQLVLEAGQELVRDLDLLLELATTSGHVRTQLGNPVSGVEVVAVQVGGEASLRATTGAEGRFALELPASAPTWSLQVRGPWRTTAVEVPAGARDVLIVVTEVGRLRLRLLDTPSGQPLREFEVRGGPPNGPRTRILGATWKDTPDPGGWIELEAPSGSLDLTVRPRDPDFAPASTSVVVPAADAPARLVELHTARGSSLALVLAEDSDRPSRRSRLFLIDQDVASRLPPQLTGEDLWPVLLELHGGASGLQGRRVAFDLERRTTLRGLPDGRYRLLDLSGGRFDPVEVVMPRDGDGPFIVRWER